MPTQHITRLQCDANTQNQFAIAYTWVIDNYTIGDWNGTAGNLVQFFSDTPGTPAIINLTTIGNINVSYVSFQDISFINGTVYADSTCTNVSGNSGIAWATWAVGSIQNITWTALDVLSDVMIQLSRDNGSTWSTIIADTTNSGTYAWTVTGPATTTAIIQVSGLVYTNPSDGSTIDFTNISSTSDTFAITQSSISYFTAASVNDTVLATSYINQANLITAIQNDFSDSYFASTGQLYRVYVVYTQQDGRQKERLVFNLDNNSNLVAQVSWSTDTRDGTWQKTQIKAFDPDGATHILNRATIGVLEDLTHGSGTMTLNNS